jgi:excisionase family DNA binding protein
VAYKKKYTQAPVVTLPVEKPVVITPAYLDVKQAAVYLSTTQTSARRWLKNQKLRCVKIGKRFTYKTSDIDSVWLRVAA